MTVTEASVKLFSWFSEKDSFEMAKDFKNIVLVTDSEMEDKAAFQCALNDLEEANLTKSTKVKGQKIWVLKKPFSSFDQTVEISADLAISISMIINEFCELINDKTDICQPASIATKDIQNLTFLYRHLQEKLIENKD